MNFERTVRRRPDPVNDGVFRALRGQVPTDDDSSPQAEAWSIARIKKLQEERKRLEDAIEAGQWEVR